MDVFNQIFKIFKMIDPKTGKIDADEIILNRAARTSIAKMASEAIFQFPVLVSNTIPLETYTMICKALERQYCSFIKVATGLQQIEDDPKMNATDWLRKMHQNDNSILDAFSTDFSRDYLQESLTEFKGDLSSLIVEENPVNKMGLRTESVNGSSLKSKFTMLDEAKGNGKSQNVTSAKYLTPKNDIEKEYFFKGPKEELQANINLLNAKNKAQMVSDNRKVINQRNTELFKMQYKNAVGANQRLNNSVVLIDNDIKKANELVPTLLDVTIKFAHPEGNGLAAEQTFTIGVKTIGHIISSESMVNNVYDSIRKKRVLFDFIRFTTGEIKFFKDFLAHIDDMKKYALGTRNKNDKYFQMLRNRTTQSRVFGTLIRNKKLLPNATLVLSQDEVDFINDAYGINLLTDSRSLDTLMKELSLLGVVVVNNAAEYAQFTFSGITMTSKWETYSFNALERENRNKDNDMKSLISLLTR